MGLKMVCIIILKMERDNKICNLWFLKLMNFYNSLRFSNVLLLFLNGLVQLL